jgi:pimeloyl-ACP methyl ester carboxylesterase
MEEKARARGWGEIFFGSYRQLLETLEQAMNSPGSDSAWNEIVDVDPAQWMAERSFGLAPISRSQLKKALSATFFPVHAMGYNWLRCNADSALEIKNRVNKLIEVYVSSGFKCEKVIVITHSMGGLVGRALAHPRIGGMADKILGMVHGVLPANGAPAAYKRMRCGFEEVLLGLHPGPKIIGDEGHEVTAVLGNSPGGLQLLPNKVYGSGWLRIRQNGIQFSALPRGNDPYEEVYKVSGTWYQLIRQEWLNPASSQASTFKRTCRYLDRARDFHDELGDFYHPVSYAHYGADGSRRSWEQVEWIIDRDYSGTGWSRLQIVGDDKQGEMTVRRNESGPSGRARFKIKLGPSIGAGDQTVPARSADHQLLRGRFQGVFRQTGYEHQDSYRSDIAIRSTLYSLVRIAEQMRWSDG